jgi:hypothetical protein
MLRENVLNMRRNLNMHRHDNISIEGSKFVRRKGETVDGVFRREIHERVVQEQIDNRNPSRTLILEVRTSQSS